MILEREEKMIFIKLDSLETVNKLVGICESYKEKMDVDIVYGRFTLDGCSILAVVSCMGNIVKIMPNTDDDLLLSYFIKDIEKIGGWVQKQLT